MNMDKVTSVDQFETVNVSSGLTNEEFTWTEFNSCTSGGSRKEITSDSMKSQAFADKLPKTISKLHERIAALEAENERLKLCSNISSEE